MYYYMNADLYNFSVRLSNVKAMDLLQRLVLVFTICVSIQCALLTDLDYIIDMSRLVGRNIGLTN